MEFLKLYLWGRVLVNIQLLNEQILVIEIKNKINKNFQNIKLQKTYFVILKNKTICLQIKSKFWQKSAV